MKQYIFTQPYTIRTGNFTVGQNGATGGTVVKSFSTGDVVEGVKKVQVAGIPNAPDTVSIEIVINGNKYNIPSHVVKEHKGTPNLPSNNKVEVFLLLALVGIVLLLFYRNK